MATTARLTLDPSAARVAAARMITDLLAARPRQIPARTSDQEARHEVIIANAAPLAAWFLNGDEPQAAIPDDLLNHLGAGGSAVGWALQEAYAAGYASGARAPRPTDDMAIADEDLLILVEQYGDARAGEIGAMQVAGEQEIQEERALAATLLAQIRAHTGRSLT